MVPIYCYPNLIFQEKGVVKQHRSTTFHTHVFVASYAKALNGGYVILVIGIDVPK